MHSNVRSSERCRGREGHSVRKMCSTRRGKSLANRRSADGRRRDHQPPAAETRALDRANTPMPDAYRSYRIYHIVESRIVTLFPVVMFFLFVLTSVVLLARRTTGSVEACQRSESSPSSVASWHVPGSAMRQSSSAWRWRHLVSSTAPNCSRRPGRHPVHSTDTRSASWNSGVVARSFGSSGQLDDFHEFCRPALQGEPRDRRLRPLGQRGLTRVEKSPEESRRKRPVGG